MDALLAYLRQPENSQTALAEALGVTQSAIAKWVERGKIPAERAIEISRITGIAPSLLRPDLYPEQAA